MAADLTRLPDCPTCGQPRYDLTHCVCKHPQVVHDERGRCTFTLGPKGLRCLCRGYRKEET